MTCLTRGRPSARNRYKELLRRLCARDVYARGENKNKNMNKLPRARNGLVLYNAIVGPRWRRDDVGQSPKAIIINLPFSLSLTRALSLHALLLSIVTLGLRRPSIPRHRNNNNNLRCERRTAEGGDDQSVVRAYRPAINRDASAALGLVAFSHFALRRQPDDFPVHRNPVGSHPVRQYPFRNSWVKNERLNQFFTQRIDGARSQRQ